MRIDQLRSKVEEHIYRLNGQLALFRQLWSPLLAMLRAKVDGPHQLHTMLYTQLSDMLSGQLRDDIGQISK